jgi:hypothetical protein
MGAWGQSPSGSEFLVNTYTTGGQRRPDVASDAVGNFVVVWSADDSAVGPGIIGQRFDPRGVRRGGEFRVNTYTGGFASGPVVASAADGRFVVAWNHYGQDGSGYGVFAQRFDASGAPLGAEFRVNTYTTSTQALPAVASDEDGNFVVVWQSQGQDLNQYGVFAQRFAASGAPLGSEFQVNGAIIGQFGSQHQPSVDIDGTGRFVVVWGNRYQVFGGPLRTEIAARLFDADGFPVADEFRVTATTGGSNGSPQVARDNGGRFVVVWGVGGGGFPIPTGSNLAARSFDAQGTPFGPGFAVATTTTGSDGVGSIDVDRHGRFVVVWQHTASTFAPPDIVGQVIDILGTKLGSELQVNTYTTGNQANAAVAAARDANFVVVWDSRYQNESSYGVFGQRYGDLIFRDGFE